MKYLKLAIDNETYYAEATFTMRRTLSMYLLKSTSLPSISWCIQKCHASEKIATRINLNQEAQLNEDLTIFWQAGISLWNWIALKLH